MARIVAISNQKGGVGKTTTAINLGASLAAGEKKVLLVDLDPQANATLGLGLSAVDMAASIYEVMVEGARVAGAIIPTMLPHLHIVPAVQDLVGAEVELVNVAARETRLQSALAAVAGDYDYILIDAPPALGLLTLNALTAAHSVLIPLQCEHYAVEALSQLLKTIGLVKKRLNPALEREGILLTMYDHRQTLCQQIEQDVRLHLRHEVLPMVIPRNGKLHEAASHGKPLILYDINSPAAIAYLDVARFLIRKHRRVDTVPEHHDDQSEAAWSRGPDQPSAGKIRND